MCVYSQSVHKFRSFWARHDWYINLNRGQDTRANRDPTHNELRHTNHTYLVRSLNHTRETATHERTPDKPKT